ncbi:MAG: CBS domain-containing protein [Candidatus Doudnabacteria bacterium]|nr:CBS domain-containing protein [Candidatus Doudnabacteria bacterium]
MLEVKELMTKKVISVNQNASLVDAVGIMTQNGFTGVPVTDDKGTLVGMLTEREMLSKNSSLHLMTMLKLLSKFQFYKSDSTFIQTDLKKILALKVSVLMKPKPATIGPSNTVEDALRILADPYNNPLPVLNYENKLEGILSMSDLTKLYGVSLKANPERDIDTAIDQFILNFEKQFVLVTRTRAKIWLMLNVLFIVVGFAIAMFFILRVSF